MGSEPVLIQPYKAQSVEDGAIAVMEWRTPTEGGGYYWQSLEAAAKQYHIPLDKPVSQLTAEQVKTLLYGSEGEKVRIHYTARDGRQAVWDTPYEVLIPHLRRPFAHTTPDSIL